MTTNVTAGNVLEVTCPHCRKSFSPTPLPRPSARHRGAKCPHCRLFVPVERAADAPLARDPG